MEIPEPGLKRFEKVVKGLKSNNNCSDGTKHYVKISYRCWSVAWIHTIHRVSILLQLLPNSATKEKCFPLFFDKWLNSKTNVYSFALELTCDGSSHSTERHTRGPGCAHTGFWSSLSQTETLLERGLSPSEQKAEESMSEQHRHESQSSQSASHYHSELWCSIDLDGTLWGKLLKWASHQCKQIRGMKNKRQDKKKFRPKFQRVIRGPHLQKISSSS